MIKRRILCFDCKYRREIPGNTHIRCGARVTDDMLKEIPLLGILVSFNPPGLGWANFNPAFPKPVFQCNLYARRGAPEDSPQG